MEAGSKRVERRLAAIFAADVAGYSRLMEQDEVGTLRALTAHREVMDRLIAEHGGRIANTGGDSVIAEFRSVVDAVECAVEVQKALFKLDNSEEPSRALRFRVGIHVGDVMVRGGDLLGDGVNIAARLEGIAEPGGVCISGAAYDYVRKSLPLTFTDLGSQQVKNIEEPIQAYAIQTGQRRPEPAKLELTAPKTLSLPDKPSIAVLPFINIGNDAEQEYFADGVVEDIITALSRMRWLFVTARNSTFTYKGKAIDVKQVGRDLGVRYVLEGSVRRAGSRLRITAQLIEAQQGGHVWAERYDRDLSDLFDVQDEITSSVVGAIEPQLVAAEAHRVERRAPTDLQAWECTVRALPFIWKLTVEDTERAQEWLQRSIDLDPQYAHPQALMAWSYMKLWGLVGYDRQPNLIVASEKYARSAALLDDREPWVYLASGLIHTRRREPEEALVALKRAIDLNPNFALAYAYLGYAYGMGGQPHAGLEALDRASRLSPRDPFLATDGTTIRAMIKFAAGDYEEVIKLARRVAQDRPNHIGAHRVLTASYALLGRVDEARASLKDVLRLHSTFRLSDIERLSPYFDPKTRGHLIDGFRRAGLPE